MDFFFSNIYWSKCVENIVNLVVVNFEMNCFVNSVLQIISFYASMKTYNSSLGCGMKLQIDTLMEKLVFFQMILVIFLMSKN